MSTDPLETASYSRDERLQAALAAYLEAEEAGRPLDPGAWLEGHPDLAGELASFLANRRAFASAAGPPAPSAAPAAVATDLEILDEIGRGGMGIVYRAYQRSLRRDVALKVMREGRFATSTEIQRFRLEAEESARLEHPNLVPIYGIGVREADGTPYFTMRLIDGGTLADHRAAFHAHPSAAAELVATLARALHHAHEHGVLHRDLKPSNVLLERVPVAPPYRWRPLVTDFGLARRLDAASLDPELTPASAILGTPAYMAPEQALPGDAPLTRAVDVWALGAILYELLTGRPPLAADSPLETLRRLREADPAPPRALRPDLDTRLEAICMRCLPRDPAARYPNAAALADDLDTWLSRHARAFRDGLLRRAVRRVAPGHRRCLRRRTLLAGLLAVVALLGAWGLMGFPVPSWLSFEKPPAPLSYEQQFRLAAHYAGQERWEEAQSHLEACQPGRRGLEWHLLHGICRQETVTLPLPSPRPGQWWGAIRAVIPGRDGWRVLRELPTKNGGSSTAVYDLSSGRLDAVYSGTFQGVSPCGRWLVMREKRASVWDLATGERRLELEPSGLFSPDGQRLACVSGPNEVTVHHLAGGEAPRSFPVTVAGMGQPELCQFSPDGEHLLLRAHKDWKATAFVVLHLATGNASRVPPGPEENLSAPDLCRGLLTSDGRLLTLSHAGRPWTYASRIWSVVDGKELQRFEYTRPAEDRWLARIVPDGGMIELRGGHDELLVIYGLEGHQLTAGIELVHASRGKSQRVLTARRPPHDMGATESRLYRSRISPDGERLLAWGNDWSWDGGLLLLNTRTLEPLLLLRPRDCRIVDAQFGPGGQCLVVQTVTASGSHQATVYDLRPDQPRPPHPEGAPAAPLTPADPQPFMTAD